MNWLEVTPQYKYLIWIASGLGFYFLRIPLMLYLGQRYQKEMLVLPFDYQEMGKQSEMTRFFDQTNDEMQQIGFESLGTYLLPNVMDNVKAVVHMFRNQKTRESAMVCSIWGLVWNEFALNTRYTEFVCRFDHPELQLIQTMNSTTEGSFPEDPLEMTFQLPHVQCVISLYQYHSDLVQRHALTTRRVLRIEEEFQNDAAEYIRQILIESFDRQVPRGYLKPSSQGWAPTIYGAYAMTWKLLWPFKQIRYANICRRALRITRELDEQRGDTR